MSKIEELIEKYCPDGVEYKELNEVCDFISGFAFKASSFKSEGLPICKTTNIQNGLLDFSNMEYFELKDYSDNLDKYIIYPQKIVIGMSGTIKVGINNTNNICYLNQRVGMFNVHNELNNKFLYYVLCNSIEQVSKGINGGSVKNLSNDDIKCMKIPVPPIEVQNEIVRILGNFTEFTAELTAELTVRKQQYEFYRNKLLNFGTPEDPIGGARWSRLEEIVDYIQPNKYIVSDTRYSDDYKTPVLTAGQSFILGYTNEENNIFKANKEKPVIIFDDFTTSMQWVDFNFKVKSSAMKFLKPKEGVNIRYVYYAMQCINYVAKDHSRQWISVYSKFEIPMPSLDRQNEIVKTLDNFDSMIKDFEKGLSAEIEVRQQQYEYYRNKLLSFKEKK